MPNGAVWGLCWHCQTQETVHMRNHEDYLFFCGWFCEPCLDWIDIHQEQWRLYRLFREADSTASHWLTTLLGTEPYGQQIAEFLA